MCVIRELLDKRRMSAVDTDCAIRWVEVDICVFFAIGRCSDCDTRHTGGAFDAQTKLVRVGEMAR